MNLDGLFSGADIIRIEGVIRHFNQVTGKPLVVPAALFEKLNALEVQGDYIAAQELGKTP